MSPEEYWEGNPYLAQDYYKAHKLYIEQKNQELWLQGVYFCKALDTVIGNAFRKSGSPALKYFEKPLDLFATDEKEVSEETKEKERKKAVAAFEALRKAMVAKNAKNRDSN